MNRKTSSGTGPKDSVWNVTPISREIRRLRCWVDAVARALDTAACSIPRAMRAVDRACLEARCVELELEMAQVKALIAQMERLAHQHIPALLFEVRPRMAKAVVRPDRLRRRA